MYTFSVQGKLLYYDDDMYMYNGYERQPWSYKDQTNIRRHLWM